MLCSLALAPLVCDGRVLPDVAGIVPYINASIILQLLATTFPSLKKLQREEGPQVGKHNEAWQAVVPCSQQNRLERHANSNVTGGA